MDRSTPLKTAEELQESYGDSVIRLDNAADYITHLAQAIGAGQRSLSLFSNSVNAEIWGRSKVVDSISRLARRNRQSQVQILIQDASALAGRRHRLITLSQRLTSHMTVKVFNRDIDPLDHAYAIIDNQFLIYFNNESVLEGFVNYDAAAECRNTMDEFERLWNYCSHSDPNLAQFSI